VRRDASFAQKRLDLDSGLAAAEADRLRAFVQGSIPRTWILMDEAHVLVGTSEGSVARDALIKYAKEGRNYGLSLAVATQQPTALDPRLMSQAETLIVHQLTAPSDAGVATTNLRSPAPTSLKIDGDPATMDALLRRIGQGEAVFSCGNAPALQRICLAAIRPRVTAHGGYEA
jgi:DNA segregation ATPase FtsK/SpoIIIE-like protein